MSLDLLNSEGFLRLLSCEYYNTIPWQELRLWCHYNARYGLPTIELVEWLKATIGDRKAIEIGSGAGDLAYHLGIQATDNRQQEWPDVALFYKMKGQPTIKYPASVERLSAIEAIKKYAPEVIVASWVTEWVDPDNVPVHGGNMYGIKEDKIVGSGRTYILIGNINVHGHKKIMNIAHETHDFPFLKSRGANREGNRIWVWNP